MSKLLRSDSFQIRVKNNINSSRGPSGYGAANRGGRDGNSTYDDEYFGISHDRASKRWLGDNMSNGNSSNHNGLMSEKSALSLSKTRLQLQNKLDSKLLNQKLRGHEADLNKDE
mmetsp:Transcript_16097/g.27195  ORF Transcript_16097/g.27195 Transcript_16097/m.27195 type:complete len:114 (+) Transcript_16097:1924-2265(+)